MDPPTKFCQSCGAEYSYSAVACADCGGQLVDGQTYRSYFEPLEYEEGLIEMAVEVGPVVQRLADELNRKGIRTCVALKWVHPAAGLDLSRFTVYVRPEDEHQASEILGSFWEHFGPEQSGHTGSGSADEKASCPACGLPTGGMDTECPSCGLTLWSASDAEANERRVADERPDTIVEIPCFPDDEASDIEALLSERGIPHERKRIERYAAYTGGGHSHVFYVPRTHLGTALDVMKQYYGVYGESGSFTGKCPACGAQMAQSSSCPDCGLNVAEDNTRALSWHPFVQFLLRRNLL